MKRNDMTTFNVQTNRKIWIGKWLIIVAILHTIAGGIFFGKIFIDIARRGFFNTVGHDPLTAAAVWFFLFGALFALFGMTIHALEKQASFPLAGLIGISLFLISFIGIILMPDSGFWLAIPAVIGLLRISKEKNNHAESATS